MQADQYPPPRATLGGVLLKTIKAVFWPFKMLLRFLNYTLGVTFTVVLVLVVLAAVAYVAVSALS